jgi:hypothetical protein
MLKRRLTKIVGFAALVGCLWVLALAAAARIPCGQYTLLAGLTHSYQEPGGMFQSLRRFREADERAHVDIVFLGASHTYRGYDPRIFAAAGYQVMNLGSTAQTPMNSYYVAERYLPRLTPRLVVLDVFYKALALDGLESARDLSVNTDWSWPMQRMTVATGNFGAVAFEASRGLGPLAVPVTATQREISGETYVAGGYCETAGNRTELLGDTQIDFELRPLQIDYLVWTSQWAKAHGARVVWTSAPLPSDYTARIKDRESLKKTIEQAAQRADVEWWDMQDSLQLDPLAHFKDTSHLNAEGVKIFDRAFLEKLARAGYLTTP